jgi:hypothetical protein
MIKKSGLIVLVLFCLFPLQAQIAREPGENEDTLGLLNGHHWIKMPESQKTTFICALSDGISLITYRIAATGLGNEALDK